MNPQNRIPSLDGLRAVSISLVLLGHAAMPFGEGEHSLVVRQLLSLLSLGHLGVTVFFCISGFLITTLLLQEIEKTGRISLPHFYFRRTLRIFPPYYVFLLVVVLLKNGGLVEASATHLLAAFTYTTNYCQDCLGAKSWTLTHTWSLAVEEQFYLLWPLVLLLLGRRKGFIFAALLLALCPVVRVYYVTLGGVHGAEQVRYETVADTLAAGCLLARFRPRLHGSAAYLRALSSRWIAVAPLSALALSWLGTHPSLCPAWAYALIAPTLINIMIVLTIDYCLTEKGAAVRFLNARPAVYVGVISYSIYLWQELFLGPSGKTLADSVALGLLLTAVCALLSYYVVERPSLHIRKRLEPVLFAEPHQHYCGVREDGERCGQMWECRGLFCRRSRESTCEVCVRQAAREW